MPICPFEAVGYLQSVTASPRTTIVALSLVLGQGTIALTHRRT